MSAVGSDPDTTGDAEAVPTYDSAAAETWRHFRQNPLGIAAVVLLTALILVALAAPLIAPYPSGYGADTLAPPSARHWFGTDTLGRSVLAEVVWGARVSLVVAVGASALAILIGV
ncbi:MAG: ABC transporter permease, partial [Ornithinimicrobium sp.]